MPLVRQQQQLTVGDAEADWRELDRPMTQLALSGVAVEFGATRLLQATSPSPSARGERWGIIGRNGSGKTTLFRLITGRDRSRRAGTVARAGGLRYSVLEQHRDFGGATTVWEAAAGAFARAARARAARSPSRRRRWPKRATACTPQMLARYDRDLERFDREGGYTLAARVDAVLARSRLRSRRRAHPAARRLSGGERGRVGLAAQLVAPADVLLLDEPTNHLDLETTTWLEDYLRGLDATVLVISHDRAFLARGRGPRPAPRGAAPAYAVRRATTSRSSRSAPSDG